MVQKVSGDMLADGAVVDAATGFVSGNFVRVASDGTLEERTPTQVRTDIGAGTGSGTVTSVNLGATTGLTPSGGPIVGSGTLNYTLSANLQAWHGLATSAKQDTDATLTALAGANWAANSLAIGSGADTVAQVTFAANTFPGRSSTGNLVAKTITDAAFSILDDATVGAILTTIGGQPLDATLTALAGANWAANTLPIGSGADTVAQVTFNANTFPGRSSTGNLVAKTITDFGFSLIDDADAATARTTLAVTNTAATYMRANRITDQNFSAATFTTVVYATEIADPDAAYNPATGEYTVPRTGIYSINARAKPLAIADDADVVLAIFVNGAESMRLDEKRMRNAAAATGAGVQVGGLGVISLTAAQVVTIRVYVSAVAGAGTLRVLGDAAASWFTVVQE